MKDIREVVSFVGESISAASGNIAANALRSWITAAIIALGVASLVGTQTAIDSLASVLRDALGGKTSNSFTVSAATGEKRVTLSRSCLKLFEENFDMAEDMAGYTYVPAFGEIRGPHGAFSPGTVVVAFDGDYLQTNALSINQGRTFTPLEEKRGAKVCLVGQRVASAMGAGSPTGQLLTIGHQNFEVIGTISEQLSFLGVIAGNSIFIPVTSAHGSLISEKNSYIADVMLTSGTDSEEAAKRAELLLRRILRIPSDEDSGLEISHSDALKQEMDSLSGKLSMVALAVGLLTILGAAVGLTNIMLIAVRERTREIGLRRAIGATRSNIMADILTESAIICGYGCLAGILLGILVGNVLSAILHTSLQIPWDWISASCLICAAVCTAAGRLPAGRAAKMDPVEALRCE